MGVLLRRVVFAPFVFLVVAAITFGTPRLLRPDKYPGQALLGGTLDDLERFFLHFDLGVACLLPGCPPVRRIWADGMAADLWLLAGALVIGVAGGVLAGLWCVRHPDTVSSHAVQAVAAVLYCTPVYVLGLGALLMFNGTFGRFPIPAFFDADPAWASPWSDPWTWFRSLLVPWLVAAAPLGAMCMRLTLGLTREALGEDYVRTAVAKGIAPWYVVRRHAAPASYVTTASFVAISIPLVVSNLVLVERVLGVPGFFHYTWRAVGHRVSLQKEPAVDYPILQASTLWGAVLVIGAGLIVDFAILRLDPRIRRGAALG